MKNYLNQDKLKLINYKVEFFLLFILIKIYLLKLFTNVKKSWKYFKECKLDLIFYALVSIIEGVIGIFLPILSAQIVLNITNEVINQLILSSIIVFVIEMILYSMYYFKGTFYQKIFEKTLIRLQYEIAKETLKLEVKEIDRATSGLFIDRLNNDTEEIANMFMEYTYWLSYVISNVGVLVAIRRIYNFNSGS